ncbi:hypothetical protein LGQ02_19685 [Bacillus shivajii]|uniref:hypothetical protein n=1 Tax=Bacillus shivajii TaxID=1983719 RepID=UPI001CFB38D2|nr:hypothetical protein [Bacillus shivajii]UCZ52975.1 hypothetical protein LGQ02_19685 [Bacillus shivajii]
MKKYLLSGLVSVVFIYIMVQSVDLNSAEAESSDKEIAGDMPLRVMWGERNVESNLLEAVQLDSLEHVQTKGEQEGEDFKEQENLQTDETELENDESKKEKSINEEVQEKEVMKETKNVEETDEKEQKQTNEETVISEDTNFFLLKQITEDYNNGLYFSKTIEYQSKFAQNNNRGAIHSDREYVFLEGHSNILITAPHSTIHTREGDPKDADIYTGAMALSIHEYTNAHVLYQTKETKDANYYNDTAFKRELSRIIDNYPITLVIDLHGAARSRPFDVDIGTDGGSLVDQMTINNFKNINQSHGIHSVYENHTFTASGAATVANYSKNELGIQAMQVEYNRDYRDPRNKLQNYYLAVYALAEFVLSQQS